MFYDLATSSWGQEEIDAIQRVVDCGQFTMGPEVKTFEKQFAAYHRKKFAVMVNSGSSANLIAVAALCHRRNDPWQRGDEVIVPAVSWATTYHPLQQYGLKLKIIDIEIDTLNADTAALEAALGPRTRGLMAVSILGNPARLDVMRKFCDDHGLLFLEDNCESADAELAGAKLGTFGDMGTFSFFFSHHMATMEGGMLITDDAELADLARCLRNHGWTRGLSADSEIFDVREMDRFEAYRFVLPGYNVRPIEMAGAIGKEQLKKLPMMTSARRMNLALFQSLFADDDRFIIQRENGVSSSFCFPIVLNPRYKPDRDRIFAALEDADIGFRIITGGCITRHDVIRHFEYETVGDLPNANIAHDFGFFTGNHPTDLTPQIEHLYKTLDRAF